jgi:hypothetical protein
MRALRPHDLDSEAPELSRTRSLAPLAAAGTLFLLGVFGIMGLLPFTGRLAGNEQGFSPGKPVPLVQQRPVDVNSVVDLSGIDVTSRYPFEFQTFSGAFVEESEVLASSLEPSAGENAVQPIPPTPAPPPPTATPTAEPTATEAPPAEPTPTNSPTAVPDSQPLPQTNSPQPGGVVGIVSSDPQPTPPGPVREDPIDREGED